MIEPINRVLQSKYQSNKQVNYCIFARLRPPVVLRNPPTTEFPYAPIKTETSQRPDQKRISAAPAKQTYNSSDPRRYTQSRECVHTDARGATNASRQQR